MSDHEHNPKRQRTSLGEANPHPSTAGPRLPEARGSNNTPLIKPQDIAEIRAAWDELHDVGLVWMRFPRRWRGAIAVSLRLMVAEAECAACPFECREPGNPECYRLRGKLPRLPQAEECQDR